MTELQVGVHGLRTFRVSDDGHLLPVTSVDDSWRGGVCIARCRRTPLHSAPVDRCRCGIYSFRSLQVLREQYEPGNYLVAVVALEGQTLAGSKGWRSQAARVVALWVEPGALPDPLLALLIANLPGVAVFGSAGDMLAGYPELSEGVDAQRPAGVARAPVAPRPLPLRPRPVSGHRVLAGVAVGVGAGALFLAAERGSGAVGGPLRVAAERVGVFLAGHDLLLLVPLLLLGLAIAARQSVGRGARVLSALVWLSTMTVLGAVAAAVATEHHVQFDLFAAWIAALFAWRWAGLFLYSLGYSDGSLGFLARSAIQWGATARSTLQPGRRPAGVGYRPRPDHRTAGYPLVVPVHFLVGREGGDAYGGTA